jgi:hypothetical protein
MYLKYDTIQCSFSCVTEKEVKYVSGKRHKFLLENGVTDIIPEALSGSLGNQLLRGPQIGL